MLRRLLIAAAVFTISLFTAPHVSAQDSVGWTPVFDGFSNEHFTGIWGSAADNIFAVGNEGLVVHFDGTAWQYMDAGTKADLEGVWGIDENHVYAVGHGIILRYDGQAWSNMFANYMTTPAIFQGVWGATPDDLWAVSIDALIWHYDGDRWSIPVFVSPEGGDFYAIWGTASDNIYVGGVSSPLFHYDGTKWSALSIRTKDNPEGYWQVLNIWGTGPNNVYAGDLHFDGTNWTASEIGRIRVWGSSAADVFALRFPTSDDIFFQIGHFDGVKWKNTSAGKSITLTDLWGSGPDNVYAVGRAGTILKGPRFDVHIKFAGEGASSVAAQGTDFACSTNCFASFNRGTLLNLTTLPAESTKFESWSGDCSGSGACTVSVDGVRIVTATFSIKTFDLSVAITGTGQGAVTQVSPNITSTISCGSHCSDIYRYGEVVTLEANAENRSFFKGWTGDCSGLETCTVTMNAARQVAAIFEEQKMVYLPAAMRDR